MFSTRALLYGDDYASGKKLSFRRFLTIPKIEKCFQEQGFNMRKWASNSEELNEMVEKDN